MATKTTTMEHILRRPEHKFDKTTTINRSD